MNQRLWKRLPEQASDAQKSVKRRRLIATRSSASGRKHPAAIVRRNGNDEPQ
jgi:hypothetical protein